MSCESRGGVSEVPGLGAVLTTGLCFSMSCDHDRSPGAMFYIVSGEHARLTAALTIITKRESPWKRQADIIQIEGGM